MDPRTLTKDNEYTLQLNTGEKIQVFYVHETINHYVFISNQKTIYLTPSNVNSQISPYAKQVE